MKYIIREMQVWEYPLLKDFLYEAIFQRDEKNLLPRDVIEDPSLQVYIKDFGMGKDDYCLCAEAEQTVVGTEQTAIGAEQTVAGAVWVRTIPGFGHIGEGIPEFAISLRKSYRGCGIGTALMKRMLELLREKGYSRASLAVQKDNYALRMYRAVGFQPHHETEEEYILEYRF